MASNWGANQLDMEVFELDFLSDEYQCLVFDGPECEPVFTSGGSLCFDGQTKLPWHSPPLRIYNPIAKKGDFLSLCPGCLVVRETAMEELRTEFEIAGELLPVQFSGEEGAILNVTTVVNCLDHEQSDWLISKDGVTKLRCRRAVFRRDLIPESTIFKVPELPASIFAHTGHGDEEDSFPWKVESLGLTGLRLKSVWSDDDE